MKYVYKVEPIKVGMIGLGDDSKKQQKQLNGGGEDGFELVCVSQGKKYLKYVYCKEVSDEEYEAEATKAVSSSGKKPMDPKTLKKINTIFAIVLSVLSVVALGLLIAAIAISGEATRLWYEAFNTEQAYVGGDPLEYPGFEFTSAMALTLFPVVLAIVFTVLSIVIKKKRNLWRILAIVFIVGALLVGTIFVTAELGSLAYSREYMQEVQDLISQGQ